MPALKTELRNAKPYLTVAGLDYNFPPRSKTGAQVRFFKRTA
jgi:hypothetical protein